MISEWTLQELSITVSEREALQRWVVGSILGPGCCATGGVQKKYNLLLVFNKRWIKMKTQGGSPQKAAGGSTVFNKSKEQKVRFIVLALCLL